MELDPNVKCPICFGILVKTVALPCQDKFCFACIDNWARKKYHDSEQKCPLCRAVFQIPPRWSQDRQIDSIVENYVATLSADAFEDELQDRRERLACADSHVPVQLEPPGEDDEDDEDEDDDDEDDEEEPLTLLQVLQALICDTDGPSKLDVFTNLLFPQTSPASKIAEHWETSAMRNAAEALD